MLLRILGPRWKALSGSSAHGDDDKHTAEQNAKIVAEFNAGELDGIVSTSVGESAADFHNPRFVYIVIVDAHGGNASAAQRDGRLARTPRVERSTVERAEGGERAESDASLLRRRLAVQKSAFLYDLVTPKTEVCNSRATPLASHLHPLVQRAQRVQRVLWQEEVAHDARDVMYATQGHEVCEVLSIDVHIPQLPNQSPKNPHLIDQLLPFTLPVSDELIARCDPLDNFGACAHLPRMTPTSSVRFRPFESRALDAYGLWASAGGPDRRGCSSCSTLNFAIW